MEIKIGETVVVDGREFVIYSFSHVSDLEGRAIELRGMDPQRAMRHMEKQKKVKKQLDDSLDYMEKVKPVLEDMASGDDWKQRVDE